MKYNEESSHVDPLRPRVTLALAVFAEHLKTSKYDRNASKMAICIEIQHQINPGQGLLESCNLEDRVFLNKAPAGGLDLYEMDDQLAQ